MSEQAKALMEKFFRLEAQLRRIQHAFRRDRMRGASPHRGQGRVLALLKMQPEISQKDLAYLLDMRTQSLGEVLTRLERDGLITRTPSEADKRMMIIRITDAGIEAAKQVESDQQQGSRLFDVLSQEEQQTLASLLDKLSDGLDAQMGDMPEEGGNERDERWGCRGAGR